MRTTEDSQTEFKLIRLSPKTRTLFHRHLSSSNLETSEVTIQWVSESVRNEWVATMKNRIDELNKVIDLIVDPAGQTNYGHSNSMSGRISLAMKHYT